MRIKALLGLLTVVLLAGCSTSHKLTTTGQQITFTDNKPAAECQLREVTGTQSN